MSVGRLRHTDLVDGRPSPEPMPSKDSGGIRGRLYLPSDFPELQLFALLKLKFGGPNGPLTFLGPKGGDPDSPFKWDFLFVPLEPLRLQICRKTEGIEVWWWEADASSEDVLGYLAYNLEKHSSDIEKQIGALEEYTLLLNPFARHQSIAKAADSELASLQPVPPAIPAAVTLTGERMIEQYEEYSSYLRTTHRQALFSITLVSSAAFAAEAYLNLILALLMRDEVRRSDAIRTETLLRKWRTKLERLPADCREIATIPDLGDARVRDAKRLFEIRNSLAHSYPDRETMKIGTMWFDQSFPVLPQAVPFQQFAIALSNQFPSAEEARFCWSAAQAFVQFLRSLLTVSAQAMMDHVSEANPLGYNESKQIYGIPFGPHIITAAPIVKV